MTDKISVLIVDDDEPTAKMLERSLTKEGYVCLVAYNAMQALKLCEQRHFDLVITDVKMPDKDGIALTRHIKMKYDTDVIVISGYVEREKYSFVIDAGASDFIEKPINSQELKTRLARVIRERKTICKLKETQDELRNLSAYLQSVREQERKAVAREIHDELGQALTGLKMDLAWLEKRVTQDPGAAMKKIKTMEKLLGQSILLTKSIITRLRPGMLDDLGLIAAAEWEVNEFSNRTGLACDLYLDVDDKSIDIDLRVAVFRVLQECLTNIARHANAAMVRIQLEINAEILVLTIEDDGVGITPEQISSSKSFGLMGMRERAHQFNGDFTISGVKEKGTTVKITFPLN